MRIQIDKGIFGEIVAKSSSIASDFNARVWGEIAEDQPPGKHSDL